MAQRYLSDATVVMMADYQPDHPEFPAIHIAPSNRGTYEQIFPAPRLRGTVPDLVDQ